MHLPLEIVMDRRENREAGYPDPIGFSIFSAADHVS